MAFLGTLCNVVATAGTVYSVGKAAYEMRTNFKIAQKVKKETIANSDVKSIQEDFLKILEFNKHNSNTENIEITKNLEHFKIYCKAIGVEDDLNITNESTGTDTGTISLDKHKIEVIQKALISFDESVRDSTTKKLFDVDIDITEYQSMKHGYQIDNFSADPLGKTRELFNNSFNKDAVKKAEDAVEKAKKEVVERVEKEVPENETLKQLLAEVKKEVPKNETLKKLLEKVKKEDPNKKEIEKALEKLIVSQDTLISVSEPDKYKNQRIADNVFMLLQDQEKKCIEAVKKANENERFNCEDPTTLELIGNAKKFGLEGKSKLPENDINKITKLIYGSETVVPVTDLEALDSLQDGQKLSLDYNTFFQNNIKLTDKQKDYIKRNADLITVTVQNDDAVWNLIQKMNEINARDIEVNYRDNALKLHNTGGLLELLGKDKTAPKYKINGTGTDTDIGLNNLKDVKYDTLKPLDYIKIATWLHNDKGATSVHKQYLFKQIVDKKQFNAIEKSFLGFMDKIFPSEVKRYKDWGNEYETNAELTKLFKEFVTSTESKTITESKTDTADTTSNQFDGIKGYSKEAKTDIINQFLESKEFTAQNGEKQFEILNAILKDDNLKDIKRIKEACEAKATEKAGKILEHLADKLDTYSDTKADDGDDDDGASVCSRTDNDETAQTPTSTNPFLDHYSEKTKIKFFEAFLEKNISDDTGKGKVKTLAKTKDFKNIPKIKTMIINKAQEKKVPLYDADEAEEILHEDSDYDIKDLSNDAQYKDVIKFVVNVTMDGTYDYEDDKHQKNLAIASAVFKEIFGKEDIRPTNIPAEKLKIALDWIELNDSKTIDAKFKKITSKPASKRIISDKNTKKGFLSRLNLWKSRNPL